MIFIKGVFILSPRTSNNDDCCIFRCVFFCIWTFLGYNSAEELQTLRKQLTRSELPCRSGPKDSVPDDESEEQAERLEEQLEQLKKVLTEERVLRK